MKRLKLLIVLGSAAAALAVGLGAQAHAKPDFTLLAVLNAAGAQIDPS